MAIFHDLPVELVMEIIKATIPYNEHEPIIGVNAAWTELGTFQESLHYTELSELDENDPLPRSPVAISIRSGLFALRS